MKYTLQVFEAGKKISDFDLGEKKKILIGRSKGCDLQLSDRAISSEHLMAAVEKEGFWIEKRSDFSPLLLNGVEVTRQLMKPGDLLRVGKFELCLQEIKQSGAQYIPEHKEILSEESAMSNEFKIEPSFESGIESVIKSSQESRIEMNSNESSPNESISKGSNDNEISHLASSSVVNSENSISSESAPVGLDSVPFSNTSSSSSSIADSPLGSLNAPFSTNGEFQQNAGDLDKPKNMVESDEISEAGMISSPVPDTSAWGGMIQLEEVSSSPSLQRNNISQKDNTSSQYQSSSSSVESNSVSTSLPLDADKTRLASSSDLNVFLEIPSGLANVEKLDLSKLKGKDVRFGRNKDSDIVLEDKKSSRNHCVIKRVGNQYELKDLDSANGTYVNGDKVTQKALSSGDKIRIGDTEILFHSNDPAFASTDSNNSQAAYPGYGDVFVQLSGLTPEMGANQDSFSPGSSGASSANPLMGGAMRGGFGGMGGYPAINSLGNGSGNVSGFSPAQVGYGLPFGGMTPGVPVGGKQSLLDRFKRLPRRRQFIVGGIVVGLLFLLLIDEEKPIPKKRSSKVTNEMRKTAASGDADSTSAKITFDRLNPAQKKLVEEQHRIAFDFYRMRDYDKALFEIRKIFELVPEYKDAREIERYALEGIQKREAIEAEKLRREQEDKLRQRVDQQLEQIAQLMKKKKYVEAESKFSEVLAADPENPRIKEFQKELSLYREQVRLDSLRKQVEEEVTRRAYAVLDQAKAEEKSGGYQQAIKTYRSVLDVGSKQSKLQNLVQQGISRSRAKVAGKRAPLLAEAEEAEVSGKFGKAYALYSQALRIDPSHGPSAAGVRRTREQLTKQNKALYTEAVLAESYSDFEHAKRKYMKILQISPPDDLYARRARSKLKKYQLGGAEARASASSDEVEAASENRSDSGELNE